MNFLVGNEQSGNSGESPRAVRRPTRLDVARFAGVSPAVVSYTVNSGPRPVAAETRARVQEAIRILGYRPNAAARSLKVGLTKMFGLIVPDSSNPFFALLGHALEDAAAAKGYALIVVNSDGSGEQVARSIRDLAMRGVDGMLITASVSVPILAAITENGTRVVMLNQRTPVDGISAIGPDLYGGAVAAVRHLIGHGHTNISYVGEVDPLSERYRGWKQALVAAGLTPGPVAESPFSREGGYRAAQALIADGNCPTAVFVSSDMQAVGVLRAFHEAGIEVPQQVAIVGFDGSPESEYSWPALTTVRQPVREMALEAIERLVAPADSGGFTLHGTTLLVRQSCGCDIR